MKEDAPEGLSEFVKDILSYKQEQRNIIKCNFKEGNEVEKSHEVYFDTEFLFSEIGKTETEGYKDLRIKFKKFLNTYIPFSTSHIIHLPILDFLFTGFNFIKPF